MPDPRRRHASFATASGLEEGRNVDFEDERPKEHGRYGVSAFRTQLMGYLAAPPRWVAVVLAVGLGALVVFLTALVLWLRPELIGYEFWMVPWEPDCIVVQPGFKTGGNANRMEALFNAFHLVSKRRMRYLAVPEDWQAWLCKMYTPETIRSFPVSVVPTGTGAGCPAAFWPIYQDASERRPDDICEEWHLANFFRLPWYRSDLGLHTRWWRHLMPTAHRFRERAEARLAALRTAHPGKLIVTVHKRWLSVWCLRTVDLTRLERYPMVEQYCHLTPASVKRLLREEAGLEDLGRAHFIVSADGYMASEEKLFTWEFEGEDTPFMAQLWMWVLSDLHVGHPNSTIDQVACRFRRLMCGPAPSECRPCYPQALQDVIAGEFV